MANELILIVEDNERNRRLVRDVLQFRGYQTIEAETGEDAVRMARERQPALVLMDIQLPGIDGVEALARLREDASTATIPVVALTAFAMKEDRERLLQAGFRAYLEKPLNVRELPGHVGALIDVPGPEATG